MNTLTCQDPVYTHDENYYLIVLIVSLLFIQNLLTFCGLFIEK